VTQRCICVRVMSQSRIMVLRVKDGDSFVCLASRRRPFRARASAMSVLGHVWTAPWQELSDVAAALVGCGHVSGLFMRQVWPLALMLCADRVPIVHMHLEVR